LLARELDRVLQRLREAATTPAVVEDARTVRRRVQNRVDGVGCAAAAIGAQELARHDRRVPGDTGDPDVIVGHPGDGPGHVRAVAVVVHRIVVVAGEVPAEHVVDEAVVIVIDAVVLAAATGFTGITPKVGLQIFVRVVDARIDDGDENAGRTGLHVPGFRCIDVGVLGIFEPPQLAEARVIRDTRRGVDEIRFGVGYRWVGGESTQDRRHIGTGRSAINLHADRCKLLDAAQAGCRDQ
jgi:hypothetical protein